jgi:hypothetical protein
MNPDQDQLAAEAYNDFPSGRPSVHTRDAYIKAIKSAIEKATKDANDAYVLVCEKNRELNMKINESRAAHASEPDFEQMGRDVYAKFRKGQNSYASARVPLWKLIAQQLHAAYVMGETNAEYEAGRSLSSLESRAAHASEHNDTKRLIELMKHLAFSNHGFKPESCSECFNCNSVLSQTKEKE